MKKILIFVCALAGLLAVVLFLPRKQTESKAMRQQTIIVTNLPEHIQIVIDNYAHEPQWMTIKQLTPDDKNTLLQLYRQEQSIVKKSGLTIALGFIGDEEVVNEFRHTLSEKYAGRKLKLGNEDNETDEEVTMFTTVEVMGFLANKSDSGYDLLKKGFDPKFWKDYCKFTPATGPAFYGMLTSRSIHGIGWSGRNDVVSFLETLKTQPLVNNLDKSVNQDHFESDLVDAAFANDIILQRGFEYYKYLYLNADKRLETMSEWRKNGNGQAWRQWRQQREGGTRSP